MLVSQSGIKRESTSAKDVMALLESFRAMASEVAIKALIALTL